jgi:hypothetical protein
VKQGDAVISRQPNGPRGMRAPHRYNVSIMRVDGTTVVYESVKHVMWQESSLVLIMGEHDINRDYVRYPAHIIDHVVTQEIPIDSVVDPRDIPNISRR